ncbi:hypothetical protein [Sphingomonas sp. MMS24-J13]|uniref:hypothetical protein n=1 Tax=Sphingomonas sp. MMS24-J13 TaxID=3238686 RepID=UPI00384D30D0
MATAIVSRPPRVPPSSNSMAARAVSVPGQDIISPITGDERLRTFEKIEFGLGIIPIYTNIGAPLLCAGDVAVYSADWLDRNPLRRGVYAVEWQRPANALTPEMFADRYAKCEYPRMRIDREIIAVAPWPRDERRWCIRPLRNVYRGVLQMSDGPYEPDHLADKLLGPIVGLYRPSPIEGAN